MKLKDLGAIIAGLILLLSSGIDVSDANLGAVLALMGILFLLWLVAKERHEVADIEIVHTINRSGTITGYMIRPTSERGAQWMSDNRYHGSRSSGFMTSDRGEYLEIKQAAMGDRLSIIDQTVKGN